MADMTQTSSLLASLAEADPEIARLVDAEGRRQAEKIRLIPSENYVSRAVLEATGTVLTNKYSEGYPGKRYYEGQQVIDQVEQLAIERAKALFGVDHANVQPYSGSPANLAVYLAFLQPGDTIMGMALPMGGHLTHGWNVSVTGKWFRPVQYGVRKDTGRVDFDEVRSLALAERPKLIFCGGTAIPRVIEFEQYAAIAHEVGAVLAADIAHIAGLVAGGAHPSPVATRRRDLDDDAQDVARSARRDADVQGGAREGHRQGRLSGPAGRAAQPHDRGDRRRAARRRPPPSSGEYAAAIVANADALADALLERGFRPGLGRHGQPPDPGRPHEQGHRRQARRAGARPRRDRAELQHGPVRSAQALRSVGHPTGYPGDHNARHRRQLTCRSIAAWMDDTVTAAIKEDEATLDRIAAEVREFALAYPMPGWPAASSG